MAEREIPGIRPYHAPAGGWGALRATAKAVREQMELREATVTAAANQQAGGFRLPGLRMAGQEAHLDLPVLRERRQGRHLGGDQETCPADVFRRPHGDLAAAMERLPAGGSGPSDPPDGLQRRTGYLRGDRLGRGLCAYWRSAPQPGVAAGQRGVLHLGARVERGGFPVPDFCPGIRHQQFPRLLEHVPRSHQRRPAAVDRYRQGHRLARGFRPLRADHRHGAQPGHQPSADDGHAA